MRFNKKLNQNGSEIHNEPPVAMPVSFQRPPTLQEQIHRLVRGVLSQQADARGEETFEEADDFDVGDDFDPTSPYEQNFDHDQNIEHLDRQIKEARKPKPKATAQEEVPVARKKKNAPSKKSDESEEDED